MKSSERIWSRQRLGAALAAKVMPVFRGSLGWQCCDATSLVACVPPAVPGSPSRQRVCSPLGRKVLPKAYSSLRATG